MKIFVIKVFILTEILGVFSFIKGSAQADIHLAKEFAIQSEMLKEERRYLVHLPASYEKDDLYINKRYPVLVLLDADTYFLSVCGLIQALSVNDELIPEMIIVGIRNTNRSRDMTPVETPGKIAAGGFNRFIESELLKEIDGRYRTLPFRLLAGHSLAGLFAVDCFLNRSVFNAYLAIDPSLRWGNQLVIKKAESVFAGQPNIIKAILYTAQSKNQFDTDANNQKDLAFKRFKTVLDGTKSEGLIYKHEYFENDDHFSIPSIAFYRGLLFVLEGFKIPLHSPALKSTSDVVQYYRHYQNRIGAEISPPGKLINQVAAYRLGEKMPDTAIDLYKVNEIFFPNSFVVYQNLAEAFRSKGNIEMAVKYYKMALHLNPHNEKVKQILKDITG